MSSPTRPPDIDRGKETIAFFSTLCGISFIFIVLRLWARKTIRGIAFDDLFIVITWILFAFITVLICILGYKGGTRHAIYLDSQHIIFATKVIYITQAFGLVGLFTGKMAAGILIIRLLGTSSRWIKPFLWALLGLNAVVTILAVIFIFAQCSPPAALWNPSLRPEAHCWDRSVQPKFIIFGSSLNSATDFVLAFMPAPFIWGLRLPTRQRVGLILLLGVGAFSGICAAIRASKVASLEIRSDLTWAVFDLHAWASSEIFLVMICGSIPTLKPLCDRFRSKQRGTSQRSKSSSGTQNTIRKYWQLPRREYPYGHELSTLNNVSEAKTDTRVTANRSNCNIYKSPDFSKHSSGDAEIQVTRSFQVDWQ
ncbi:hypothetical protein F4777DRAFT_597225 [Nemania sp. FL0916]|nr:hypothetical protein F4777DRAFT_597225 [Nemania sp. FL0916]